MRWREKHTGRNLCSWSIQIGKHSMPRTTRKVKYKTPTSIKSLLGKKYVLFPVSFAAKNRVVLKRTKSHGPRVPRIPRWRQRRVDRRKRVNEFELRQYRLLVMVIRIDRLDKSDDVMATVPCFNRKPFYTQARTTFISVALTSTGNNWAYHRNFS